MSLLLFIQNAFRAAAPWLVGVATVFALMALGARLVERRPYREPLAQFKRLGLMWQIVIVLSVGSATRWAGVRSPLTLKHDNQSSISISHPNSEGTTIDNASVQIRRKGDSEWLTLGSPSSLNPWTAKIAGTFEMRGVGTVNGESVETPIEEVEVRFPNHYNLFNDAQVISMANSAWDATLSDCSPTNRRERGFWILLNTATSSYEAGPTIYGAWCGTGNGASVVLSPRPPDIPSQPCPIAYGAIYSVASFHCHTPTTYRPATTNFLGRKVGPSQDDKRVDKYVDHVPGIVYDYLDFPEGTWNIPPEHPINSPAGIYESFGEERRPTP